MSVLPPRYWIWSTAQGGLYRFDPGEAERLNTALDAWKGDLTAAGNLPTFVQGTDLSGAEIRLQLGWCAAFRECTPETRAHDRAVDKELEDEWKAEKDWNQP